MLLPLLLAERQQAAAAAAESQEEKLRTGRSRQAEDCAITIIERQKQVKFACTVLLPGPSSQHELAVPDDEWRSACFYTGSRVS